MGFCGSEKTTGIKRLSLSLSLSENSAAVLRRPSFHPFYERCARNMRLKYYQRFSPSLSLFEKSAGAFARETLLSLSSSAGARKSVFAALLDVVVTVDDEAEKSVKRDDDYCHCRAPRIGENERRRGRGEKGRSRKAAAVSLSLALYAAEAAFSFCARGDGP